MQGFGSEQQRAERIQSPMQGFGCEQRKKTSETSDRKQEKHKRAQNSHQRVRTPPQRTCELATQTLTLLEGWVVISGVIRRATIRTSK